MKSRLLRIIACAAFAGMAAAPVHAEDSTKPQASREDHKTHTADASPNRKDAAEKAPAHESQQDKMRRCNAEAGKKSLHGDERRAFMSSCLKG